MIAYFLVLVKGMLSAHAITNPSSSLSLIKNLSFFDLTSANESTLPPSQSTVEGNGWWYCTPIQPWNQPPMVQDDCQGVLEYFYYETMTDGGTKSMEFMSPGAAKTTHFKLQTTPRKYIFGDRMMGLIPGDLTLGTCTLAILMVQDFPMPVKLPGGYKTGPPTDSTTYLNLNRVAANLVEKCVVDIGEAGWQVAGHRDGIGVFIWSTGSQEDQEIEIEKARFIFPDLDRSGNGSAATL